MERAFGVFVAVLATAAFGLGSVAAQEATPAASDPPPLPGQSAEAEREFRTSGARDGALAFRFGVGEFVDAASAAAALPAVVERIRAQPNLAALRPATAPAFGDEAHAFAGPVPSGETTLETVILIVRADRYLYLWIASGLASDPFPDLIAVAERVFARPAPCRRPRRATARRRGCWAACRRSTTCRPGSSCRRKRARSKRRRRRLLEAQPRARLPGDLVRGNRGVPLRDARRCDRPVD